MADIIEELKRKRRTIEQFQRDKANQEGQEAQLIKQLKDECGGDVDTIEEADKLVEHLIEEKEESENLLKELDTEMSEIIYNAQPGNNSG